MCDINFYPDIKSIFNNHHASEMREVTITTDEGAFELDLHDYDSVRELSGRVKIAMEGYGYREDMDYDSLSDSDQQKFRQYLRNPEPVNEKFEQFLDRSKFTSRPMPPRGHALSHADITKFNQWIKGGMPRGEENDLETST